MIIIVKTSYLVMTSWIGTHNFAVNGVSKVLMQSNDEAAGDEEAGRKLVELDHEDVCDEDDGILSMMMIMMMMMRRRRRVEMK